jgi:hypothetical protein
MSLDHHFAEPTAIRTNLGAIFVSLELSRSTWLITSLSPGGGEKMSKHGLSAGNIAALLARLSYRETGVLPPRRRGRGNLCGVLLPRRASTTRTKGLPTPLSSGEKNMPPPWSSQAQPRRRLQGPYGPAG